MNLLHKYLNQVEFKNYDDFLSNVSLKDVESFNFGYDVVDEYAKLQPNKRALVWCNNKGEEKIFSFKDLSLLSNQCANMLLAKGIKKGDFVMSMLNRRYEYYILNIACCKIGAVIVPATYLLTPKDIVYRCNNAAIKVLVTINEDEVINHILEAFPTCATVNLKFTIGKREGFLDFNKELANYSTELNVVDKPLLADNMLVYFTSGTTGFPKMVTHNHKYPLGHIMTACYWHDVIDDGLHFSMAETGWAKFSWGKIYGQWIAGSAVFCYDYYGRFTPIDILPLIEKYTITTFCAPPTIYRFLIKEDMSKFNLSSIVSCTTAGEPLNGEVYKQFLQTTGLKIREGFGQSESAVLLGTFKYNEARPGSMGLPCPIYDIILTEDGEQVEEGKVGEITVKLRHNQFGLLCGYYKDEERTNQALNTGFYHTGDLAYKDPDGYYWFVGRKDDIIKSSGYRIGPFEVESALHEHPSVLECAITAVPDALRGQIVKATIILARGYEASDALKVELQNHVKHATAPYKYPRIIEFVTELPKTTSGKILRKDIRKVDETK